jgi:hypothetical protein
MSSTGLRLRLSATCFHIRSRRPSSSGHRCDHVSSPTAAGCERRAKIQALYRTRQARSVVFGLVTIVAPCSRDSNPHWDRYSESLTKLASCNARAMQWVITGRRSLICARYGA